MCPERNRYCEGAGDEGRSGPAAEQTLGRILPTETETESRGRERERGIVRVSSSGGWVVVVVLVVAAIPAA